MLVADVVVVKTWRCHGAWCGINPFLTSCLSLSLPCRTLTSVSGLDGVCIYGLSLVGSFAFVVSRALCRGGISPTLTLARYLKARETVVSYTTDNHSLPLSWRNEELHPASVTSVLHLREACRSWLTAWEPRFTTLPRLPVMQQGRPRGQWFSSSQPPASVRQGGDSWEP